MAVDFNQANRDLPMDHTVAFHDVPMFRMLAMALHHAERHGAAFYVNSADRRDAVLKRFNAKYGTNLHGQAYLYANQGKPGFFPANPPNMTSHCLFSDGNPAYRVGDQLIPAGGVLPDWMLGIDANDVGGIPNDCSRLVASLERLGYHVTRPYHSGAEAHHFVFTSSPIPVLLHWNQISAKAAAAVGSAG